MSGLPLYVYWLRKERREGGKKAKPSAELP
jgi:hypothetical protein